MPIKGAKFRFRKIKEGEQRLAFVKGKVVEILTIKKGRKELKRIR